MTEDVDLPSPRAEALENQILDPVRPGSRFLAVGRGPDGAYARIVRRINHLVALHG